MALFLCVGRSIQFIAWEGAEHMTPGAARKLLRLGSSSTPLRRGTRGRWPPAGSSTCSCRGVTPGAKVLLRELGRLSLQSHQAGGRWTQRTSARCQGEREVAPSPAKQASGHNSRAGCVYGGGVRTGQQALAYRVLVQAPSGVQFSCVEGLRIECVCGKSRL